MAILEREVIISINSHNYKHYGNLGYEIPRHPDGKFIRGSTLLVKVGDLSSGSNVRLTKVCDMRGCENVSHDQIYQDIIKSRKKTDGKDRCNECGMVYRANSKKNNVKYEKSLECHAINNNKQYLLDEFSNKNKRQPIEISKGDNDKYIWHCLKCNKEYKMSVNNRINDHGCSCGGISKGEERILSYLKLNNLCSEEYKSFNGLCGVNNRKLTYDFYIPFLNLLIEFQGQHHERPVDFGGKGMDHAVEKFKTQQEHDKRKREYASLHNINLLEIWYWDFDRIEEILSNRLNEKKVMI